MAHVLDFDRTSTPPMDFAMLALALVVVFAVTVLDLL